MKHCLSFNWAWKRGLFIFLALFAGVEGWSATFIWSGGGTDANWSTGANWTGGIVPANNGTAAIVLAGTTQVAPNVDAGWDIGSLAFSNNAGGFTLGGGALNIRAGGITNNSALGQVINNAITLVTNQAWNAASGTLTFNGNVNNVTNLLTVSGSFNLFVTGVISGTGGVTKLGTGTNFLSGTNTYSGLTTVSAGVLNIQNPSALGGTNLGTTVASGAVLQLQGGIFVTNEALNLSGSGLLGSGALRSLTNDNTWGGVITLGAATTIGCDTNSLTLPGGIVNSTYLTTFMNTGTINLTGAIGNGTGGITKIGAGTLFLSASNSYGGLTTVSAGALTVKNSSALGTTNSGTTVASGAVLQLQGDVAVPGETLSLNGSGISGLGVLRNLGGSNSWSGLITLAASSTINAESGTLDLEANITNSASIATFTNNGTIIFNGGLGSGTGGFIKYGAGLMLLGGTNTYTGSTTINAGTVRCTAPGILSSVSATTVNTNGVLDLNSFNQTLLSLAGTGPGSVALGGATLTAGATTSTTFAGVLSGTGSLLKTGISTMTLSGVNTYTGGTTINAGAISVSAASGIGSITNALTLNGGALTTSGSAITFIRAVTLGANNGTFNIGGTSLTLSNVISGPGALVKMGTQILVLAATNTYLGGTTNAAGTLTIGSDAALGDAASSLTFSNTATLTTTASFTSTRNIFLLTNTATFSCGTGFTNTFNGVISGAGALTQGGSGTMVLGGNNTFTNLLYCYKGIVRLGGNERLSDLVPVLIAASLELNGFNETIGSLAGTGGTVKLGGGFLTAGGNNLSRTNAAVISGTGGFTKTGAGVLIFTGANTYTSNTIVGAGTLQLGANERIANTSPLVISNGATFTMAWNGTNYSETVASLAGAGSVVLGATLTAGNTGTANFSGSISGAGAFTKVGAGTQIFSGINSFTGATTISQGNLQVNGAAANSAVTIAALATVSGNGTVGTVAVNSGATNSPGASAPGTLGTSSETWAGGGNYVWEINNATGAKGASSGWDWLNLSGALNITANAGSKFNLKIVSLTAVNATGQVMNFDNTVTYIWTIASASGGITGFNAAGFNLDTSAFQNNVGAGTFTLSQSGNDLNLIFTSATLAAVKTVQSGTLTSTGNGTNTVTLGVGVNPTNSFLIFNTRHNSGVPGGSMIRGRLVNSNSVEFVRATTETSTMNIQWYVAEYSTGVKVQRGEVNQTNTTINLPLSALSATNQAFVLWSKTPDPTETAFTDSDPVVGEITSVSNLQFRVTSAPSSVPIIAYQVVEFLNPASIGVQHGSITNLTGTNLSATATLPSPMDLSSTFVVTGYRTSGSGSSIGAHMVRAQLTNSTSILFDRSLAGAPDNISEIAWQAVQLKDGSVVQSGSVTFINAAAQTNVNLTTTLNTNRVIAFASVASGGGQNTGRSPSTGTVLGVGSATLAMTSNSQVTLDRNNTSDQADIGWSVVGLGPSSILAPATGGAAISADTTTNTYTSLTGPLYTEIQSANIGLGNVILKVPAGFIFDTNTPLPNVLVTRVGGSGANSLNINGVASGTSIAMTNLTPTNLTFSVTNISSGGVVCSLTWQNIRVRPTAGTPLASGNLVSAGISTVQGVTTNSTSWGFLAEAIGAATKLALSTAPSANVTAGADFPQQPVVQIQDQFGNLRTADNANVVTATSSGTDTNNVNGYVTVVNGMAAFSGMDYQIAQTNTITFSSPGLTSKTSSNIVVNAAAASQVTVVTQPPATTTAGINFTPQPVVQVQDQFGNLRKTDNGTTVTASINQGSDILYGTQTLTATNGVVTFTNLSYQLAETITIDFTATTLDVDTSTGIAVGAAAASQLVVQTQPSAVATAGAPFAQQPAILIADQFGNLCVTNNSTVVTAARNAGSGTLQGGLNVTASSGVATFVNLSHNVATTISVDFNSGILTNTTSGSIAINAAGVAKLAFVTQPGAATVGSIFGTQPALVTQDTFGNNSVAGLANGLNVSLALSSGFGALLGTTNLDLGTGAGNGTASFTDLRINFAGSKQLTATASGLASAMSLSFTVAQGSQTILFGALADKTYGDAPFAVSASASSGLPITFSIQSGPASVTDSNVTLTGAGTVTVRASQPGDTNYTAAAPVDQSFTTGKGGPTVLVLSSANPSGFKAGVMFTAVLPANATGSVNFLTNGVALSANSLSSGSAASTATTFLPRGTNTVTVQYAGDGNYFGSTNNLSDGQIVTNHPPAAVVLTVQRTAGLKLHILWSDVVTNWSDADGDPVTLTGINLATTNNVNLLTNSMQILYTNGPNVNDQITYALSDGLGGTNTGVINVVINPFVSGQQSGIVSIVGNSTTVQFYGIPTYTYLTQRSTNLVNWVNIATNIVPATGLIIVTDTFGDLGGTPASAYYRLGWSP